MSQHIFDYAIIGSGLAGLATATRLARETQNIVILDGSDFAGGANRPAEFPTGRMNNGLRHVADTSLSRSALLFLEDLLGLKIIKSSSTVPPVTFEDGQLREFLGFGDQPPEFYELMTPFTNPNRIDLNLEPHAWTSLLAERFQGTFMPRSYVTRINVEEGRAVSLTINGSKALRAHNVIYAGSPKELAPLLSNEVLHARARSKLTKNVYWTGVCLDLCHAKPQTDSTAVHILNGTTQDELGPCAGHFLAPVETDRGVLQSSQWITFLDEEVTENSEVVAHALKKIKRQIKRAYPEALEGLIRERIVIAPMIAGDGDLKLNADQTMPEVANLWIASSNFAPERGVVSALQRTQLILASLGFGPATHAAPVASEPSPSPEP